MYLSDRYNAEAGLYIEKKIENGEKKSIDLIWNTLYTGFTHKQTF